VKRIKDTKGREWDIAVNVLTLGRVRDTVKVNLLEAILPENGLVERLAGDLVELAWVLFLIVQDQAESLGVADKEFYAYLDRDALDDGLRAILEGVVSFSPSGLRPAYRKVLETARRVEATQAEKIKTLIDSPEFDAMLDSEISKALSSPTGSPSETTGDAGSSPASSESTLPTGASAGDTPSQP
jgi:hypothetical protein